MTQQNDISNDNLVCKDCIKGLSTELRFRDGRLLELRREDLPHEKIEHLLKDEPSINDEPSGKDTHPLNADHFLNNNRSLNDNGFSDDKGLLIGPGLIDLQVNGVNGIDFNNTALTTKDVKDATYWLLSQGITTYLPTIITNTEENICRLVAVIHQACTEDELVDACIHGIHLEGPFLSAEPGARGAHNKDHTRLPDWNLFQKFQTASGGRIRLITLAPELPGSAAFISNCRANNILVSIGHSMATATDIDMAIRAGAGLCTHLGNAVPLMMPRHPNILWDLIARDELYACIIADGIHIPDSFIKVVMKARPATTLVVSDATCFAGMAPGEYQNHIGGAVVLDEQKRVSLKSEPGMLAGAAKTITENIETLISHQLTDLRTAWSMCSVTITEMFNRNNHAYHVQDDHVIFSETEGRIDIRAVIKNGRLIYQSS